MIGRTVTAGEPRITTCDLSDASVLADLGRRTFVETYADQTPADDMREHLASAYSLDRVETELAEPESAFFVARVEGAAAGYLKVNRGQAQSELREADGFEIESLYVLRAFRGRGIGKLLLDTAIDEAKRSGARYVWLGVWERNAPARRFWRRMGFIEFDSHAFRFGGVRHRDVMMRRTISA
jgi:diamine N-acetyltransferase